MHPFEVLADPVRRRILEVLGPGEVSAGDVAVQVGGEFGITQPAVSQHLKALRQADFVAVRADANRRYYRVQRETLAQTGAWFDRFRDPFGQSLDALATELARGERRRRRDPSSDPRSQPDAGTGATGPEVRRRVSE